MGHDEFLVHVVDGTLSSLDTRQQVDEMTGREVERISTLRCWCALVLLCITQFMLILDTSMVTVALPSIEPGLGFRSEGLQRVITAYTLAALLLGIVTSFDHQARAYRLPHRDGARVGFGPARLSYDAPPKAGRGRSHEPHERAGRLNQEPTSASGGSIHGEMSENGTTSGKFMSTRQSRLH